MTDAPQQPPDLACPTRSPDVEPRLVGAVGRAVRIVVALFAGALLGAGLTAGWTLVEGLPANQAGPAAGLALAPIIFVIALPIWAIGLLAVGLPVLGLLHAAGVRSRRVAAAVGALLVGLVATVLMGLPGSSNHDSAVLAFFAAGLALIGAIIGGLVAHVAYGPHRPRDGSR